MKNVGICGKNIKWGQRFFVKALDFLAISLLSICQSYYDQSKDETGSQRKPKPKRESPSLVTAKMVKLWLRERFVQRLRCQTESQHGVSEGSAYDIVKSRPTLVAPWGAAVYIYPNCHSDETTIGQTHESSPRSSGQQTPPCDSSSWKLCVR